MKTRLALGVLVSLSLCVLTGCPTQQPPGGGAAAQGSGAGKTTGGKKLRIAVIPKGESHEFWKSVRAAQAPSAGKEYDLDVTFKGPAREGDTSDQITMMENKIADKVDGICLAPVDAVALREAVTKSIAAGIPVVIFDSGLADDKGIVSFVATDNYKGGERAADHLAKLMGGKGNVILMRYNAGSQSTEQREQGFLDKIATHKDIKVLVKDKNAGTEEADAVRLAENLLDTYGEQVDGIFCPNQPTTSGMLTVLTERFPKVAKKVKFVGFDSGTNIAKALEEGKMQGTVLQDPVTMGHMAVETMKKHLRNETGVKKNSPVPEELAKPDNLKEKKIHDLLYPAVAE